MLQLKLFIKSSMHFLTYTVTESVSGSIRRFFPTVQKWPVTLLSVHRDIKLGNILLKRRVAKLADFGLAINYHVTEQKQICGTPNFLAPEVLRHRSHQPKSDLWATGCVLFCLLTGKTPFQYTKMSETAKNILSLNYQMPNYLSAEASSCIKNILKIDTEKRWDHAQIQNRKACENLEKTLV